MGTAVLPGRAWAICPTDGCDPDPDDDCYEIGTPVTVGGLVTVVCDLDVTETTDLDAYAIASHEGDDYEDAGAGADRGCTGAGDDLVHAGAGADDVVDDGGTNTLNGGTGGDRLQGLGDDAIDGGPDTDYCSPQESCEYSLTADLHECPT
ncbi:hypothetical protein L6R53_21185 [Myxococcota bacterium]|nr:hypothetical protein [Myxococcota bacterium]